jgi:hypothetical protein
MNEVINKKCILLACSDINLETLSILVREIKAQTHRRSLISDATSRAIKQQNRPVVAMKY